MTHSPAPSHSHSPSSSRALPLWPYPRWVAHRGAGQLAPENTLAALRLGAQYGYRMFECDVKLSSDGVPFLMHDATLERTTNAAQSPEVLAQYEAQAWPARAADAQRVGGHYPWSVLSRLDAGSWHSPRYAGEPLPTLEAIARFCIHNGLLLNIEIKPTPGTQRHTGEVVARAAARFWAAAPVPPLLTSFEPEALAGAMAAQPELPRGLLLDQWCPNWLETAHHLACQALVCNHLLWSQDTVAQARQAGLRTLSYTVNEQAAVQHLLDLGTDGIITDRVDCMRPE